VALLLNVAAFFRDEVYGVIGNNMFALTPKSKLVRNVGVVKYSFTNEQFINPRIIDDLIGWLADTGSQIVAVNVGDSNNSNRYYASITIENEGVNWPVVKASYDEGWCAYHYLGCSFSGVHLVRTWRNSGGSGIFSDVCLLTLSADMAVEWDRNALMKNERLVLKLMGVIPLGDRYQGNVKYRWGLLSIPACEGLKALRMKRSLVVII